MRANKSIQGICIKHGDIAVGHQDRARKAMPATQKLIKSTLHRTTGSGNIILVCNDHIGVIAQDFSSNKFTLVTNNRNKMIGVSPRSCVQRVTDH